MSSGTLYQENSTPFLWQDSLDPTAYILATYYFETDQDPLAAAIAMAGEQSTTAAAHPDAPGYDLETHTARVVSVEQSGELRESLLPAYWLNTMGYRKSPAGPQKDGYQSAITRIAFPLANFAPSMTGLWNVVVGELPRLGFLNAVRLVDLEFPPSFLNHFSGPRYGLPGLRAMLELPERPLFCRSARPAVGLSVEMMLEINQKVLRGGFDVIKDDELTYSPTPAAFRERVDRNVDLVKRIEQETGHRKLYFANVIEDIPLALERAAVAEVAGVDGVIIAPAIQGFSIISEIARQSNLLVLAHCTVADIWTRLPRFGVDPALILKLQRLNGADLVMLPGDFSTGAANPTEMQACMAACLDPLGAIKPAMPIMAGGKQPQDLPRYIKSAGGTDFMLIVATAVDEYPAGTEAGARAFDHAWSAYRNNLNLKGEQIF